MASYKVTVLVNLPDNFNEDGVRDAVGEALSGDEDIRAVDVLSIERAVALSLGDAEANFESRTYQS